MIIIIIIIISIAMLLYQNHCVDHLFRINFKSVYNIYFNTVSVTVRHSPMRTSLITSKIGVKLRLPMSTPYNQLKKNGMNLLCTIKSSLYLVLCYGVPLRLIEKSLCLFCFILVDCYLF
jgi:hypothetical protein